MNKNQKWNFRDFYLTYSLQVNKILFNDFFYLKIFSNNSFNKLEIIRIENIYLNVRLLRIHLVLNIGSEQNKREILMRISEVASIT